MEKEMKKGSSSSLTKIKTGLINLLLGRKDKSNYEKCQICLRKNFTTNLSEVELGIVLKAFMIQGGLRRTDKTSTLHLCEECGELFSNLIDLYLKLDIVRRQFNDLRSVIGKQMICKSLNADKSEWIEWEMEITGLEETSKPCSNFKKSRRNIGVATDNIATKHSETQYEDSCQIDKTVHNELESEEMRETSILLMTNADKLQITKEKSSNDTTTQNPELILKIPIQHYTKSKRKFTDCSSIPTASEDENTTLVTRITSSDLLNDQSKQGELKMFISSPKRPKLHTPNNTAEVHSFSPEHNEVTTTSASKDADGLPDSNNNETSMNCIQLHYDISNSDQVSTLVSYPEDSSQLLSNREQNQFIDNPYIFSCSNCDLTFDDTLSVRKHYVSVHFSGSLENGDHQCSLCLQFFTHKEIVLSHLKSHHFNQSQSSSSRTGKPINIMCFICAESPVYKSAIDLQEHQKTSRHQEELARRRSVYCNVCRINFKGDITALQLHLQSAQHSEEIQIIDSSCNGRITCIPCREFFNDVADLVEHNKSLAHKSVCSFRLNTIL